MSDEKKFELADLKPLMDKVDERVGDLAKLANYYAGGLPREDAERITVHDTFGPAKILWPDGSEATAAQLQDASVAYAKGRHDTINEMERRLSAEITGDVIWVEYVKGVFADMRASD